MVRFAPGLALPTAATGSTRAARVILFCPFRIPTFSGLVRALHPLPCPPLPPLPHRDAAIPVRWISTKHYAVAVPARGCYPS